jgi:DNA-binding GntR family transcriptional regulator
MTLSLNTPAYELLRDRLREEIISGEIKAGTRLTIEAVASRFQVSHQPVREAFQWLKGEGLITILPHKGAHTRALDVRLVRNIYDIRAAIESLMARLSIDRLDSDLLNDLRKIQQRLRKSIEKGRVSDVVRLDKDFHSVIYRLADNPEALEIYERYAGLLFSLRKRYGFGNDRLQRLLKDHEGILKALEKQESDETERLVRAHSVGAKEDLLRQMEKMEDRSWDSVITEESY